MARTKRSGSKRSRQGRLSRRVTSGIAIAAASILGMAGAASGSTPPLPGTSSSGAPDPIMRLVSNLSRDTEFNRRLVAFVEDSGGSAAGAVSGQPQQAMKLKQQPQQAMKLKQPQQAMKLKVQQPETKVKATGQQQQQAPGGG